MAAEQTKSGGTFFDAAYSESERSILAEIRREAFGEDIGQFSWITRRGTPEVLRAAGAFQPTRTCSMSPVVQADRQCSSRKPPDVA